MFAPLTTVVNTFGGTWFDKDWKAEGRTRPEFKQAVNFYVNLIKAHGEPGASQAGFTECLNAMSQSKVAMWYDATSAAGSLEDPSVSARSPARSATCTRRSRRPRRPAGCGPGRWVMPKTTKNADAAVEVHALGHQQGLREARRREARLVAGPGRQAGEHLRDPGVQEGRRRLRRSMTLQSIEEANPEDPGVQPRPTIGVQFVDIPEFQDLGTKVSQDIAAAIAGRGDRRRRPEQGPGARRGRRQEVPETSSAPAQHRCGADGLVRPPHAGSSTPGTEPAAPGGTMTVQRQPWPRAPRPPATQRAAQHDVHAGEAGVGAARCCRP